MEFFNKLGKKATEAYKVTADKTGKLAKETKLRVKIAELRTDITKAYEEIGKEVYQNHSKEQKEDITNVLEEKCSKIDDINNQIEELSKECLNLKDKRQCPNCHAEIDVNVDFCPKCGAKQETPKDYTVEDVESETEETETADKSEETENSDEDK